MKSCKSRPRIAITLAAAVLLGLGSLLSTAWVAQMQVRHAQAMNAKELGWKDSLVFLVFGLERRFIHFQRDLAEALVRPDLEAAQENLALQFDLLVSRINLLKEAKTVGPLRSEPQYARLMEGLEHLVEVGDTFLQAPSAAAGEALIRHMDGLQDQVQEFTALASSFSANLVETQFALAQKQAMLIFWLCGAQLLIALVLACVLWFGNKQSAASRTKLQALTGELQAAKIAAEAASQSKSRFLANMSHELRTPFQGVLGMLQLLDRSGLSPDQRELVGGAQQSAQHLLMLLNDILDFSSVEAGKLTLKPAPADLHRLCAEVHGQMLGQAGDHGLSLELQMDPRLPCWVVVDATRLKQILFNLLGNAIKFTERGKVVLQVLSDRSDEAHVLRFRVMDTGIGMDAATMARVFHRFETGNDSLTRPAGGTGLGLEISRGLARLMGGDISVQSELGKGSCFELMLSVQEAQALQEREDQAEPPPDITPPRALRILVADDHPINQKYLDMALRSLGHVPTVCADGRAAVEAVSSGQFDAAIMDIHMPVLDGLAAVRRVRQLPGRVAALPIFVLTADVMGQTQAQAQAAGATLVLSKPLQLAQLSAALAQLGAPAVRAPSEQDGHAVSDRLGELQARLPAGELQRLLDDFLWAERGSVMCLERALRAGDASACRDAAHALSGTAAVLGFDGITAAAKAVRQAIDTGTLIQDAPALERQLARAVGAAHEAMARARNVPAICEG